MSRAPYILTVCGGKGGTGKSTVATALSLTLSQRGHSILLVDLDVDGPSTANLLGVSPETYKEISTFKPIIVREKCLGCGRCVEVCQEHALIHKKGSPPILLEDLCSGCTACLLACPNSAIEQGAKSLGRILHCKAAENLVLLIGELKPGEARSPVAALHTREEARRLIAANGFDMVVVDSAPGVGNLTAQALLMGNEILAVTEPTPLGLHDLLLILGLAEFMGKPAYVVLNKSTIPHGNPVSVKKACGQRGVEVIAEIPFDLEFLKLQSVRDALRKSRSLREAASLLADFFEARM